MSLKKSKSNGELKFKKNNYYQILFLNAMGIGSHDIWKYLNNFRNSAKPSSIRKNKYKRANNLWREVGNHVQ